MAVHSLTAVGARPLLPIWALHRVSWVWASGRLTRPVPVGLPADLCLARRRAVGDGSALVLPEAYGLASDCQPAASLRDPPIGPTSMNLFHAVAVISLQSWPRWPPAPTAAGGSQRRQLERLVDAER